MFGDSTTKQEVLGVNLELRDDNVTLHLCLIYKDTWFNPVIDSKMLLSLIFNPAVLK